jgi:hypothetical protein
MAQQGAQLTISSLIMAKVEDQHSPPAGSITTEDVGTTSAQIRAPKINASVMTGN